MSRQGSRYLSIALLVAAASGCDGTAGLFASEQASAGQATTATSPAREPVTTSSAREPALADDREPAPPVATAAMIEPAGNVDGATRPFAFQAPTVADGPATCGFNGLTLPADAKLFAAGAYGGRKLDYQIDQSGSAGTQIDVAVNHTGAPVVLMLGSYEPTVWNIGWSSGTQILAVLVSGYHRQVVTGLPANVPMLVSTYDNKGACGYYYYVTAEKAGKLNPAARRVFGRTIDMVFPARDGRVVIGDPLGADTRLVTDQSAKPPQSFRTPDSLLAGPAGLEYAVRQGLLRRARQADADAWLAARAARPVADMPPIAGGRPPGRISMHNGYVVQKAFVFPAGLYGAHSATFFVPKGVPRPTGNAGHSSIYDFNTLDCSGALCNHD